MSERLRSRLYAFAILALGTVVTVLVLASPSEADRVERLGNSIRCPVCQGESIVDSPSSMARDMMALVSERVSQGWSDEEIVDELLASYSGAMLLDPPASGSTLLLWVAPILALLVGAGIIVWWERHPGELTAADIAQPEPRSRKRALVGGLILAAAFAGVVVTAGFLLQDRQIGPAAGLANLTDQSLEEVSNETMEAVIAANEDDPQIDGMRLALAERYFTEGDFRSAFPHYLAVARSDTSSDAQAVAALIRLGWMAWEGNGEADAAIGMFDQALQIDDTASTARYLKGRVLWCGEGDPDAAARLFAEVLQDEDLPEESREVVSSDLDSARNGEECA